MVFVHKWQVRMSKVKTNPDLTQVCDYTGLFQTQPRLNPKRVYLLRWVELNPGWAFVSSVYTQKLTWVDFNPGWTWVSHVVWIGR